MKPKVCVDFDGVLNNYTHYDENDLSTPRQGAKEFLETLSKNYTVVILTARNFAKVWNWLQEYDLSKYVHDVTGFKPAKVKCFVDGRAIGFQGDYDETLERISNFRTYWEE